MSHSASPRQPWPRQLWYIYLSPRVNSVSFLLGPRTPHIFEEKNMPANTRRTTKSESPTPSGSQVIQRRHWRFNFLERFGVRGRRDPVSLQTSRSPSGQRASPTTSSMVVDSPGGRPAAAWQSESSLAPAGVEPTAEPGATPRVASGISDVDGMSTAAVAYPIGEERRDAYHSWQDELRAQSQVNLGSYAAGLGSPMSPKV